MIYNRTGIELYTDCSKDKNKVAAAAVIHKVVFSARLPDEANIFSAEAKAIELQSCLNIHILQYFQIHFPVYSLFIV